MFDREISPRSPITGQFLTTVELEDDELVERLSPSDATALVTWLESDDENDLDTDGDEIELGGYDEDYDMSWYNPEGENDYATALLREFEPADENEEDETGDDLDEDGEMTHPRPQVWSRDGYDPSKIGHRADGVYGTPASFVSWKVGNRVRKSWARHPRRFPIIGFTETDLRKEEKVEELIDATITVIEEIADIVRDLRAA